MIDGSKSPRGPETKRPREEEYRGIEQLDRPELDDVGDEEAKGHRKEPESEDWLNDTGVRRSPRNTPAPPPESRGSIATGGSSG